MADITVGIFLRVPTSVMLCFFISGKGGVLYVLKQALLTLVSES